MDVASDRLVLRPLRLVVARAMADGRRLPDWAEDFPEEGDVRVATGLVRAPAPEPTDEAPRWGHFQILERATATVVGGIGFHGPPVEGEAEIGYGVVSSRRGRGYATEAVQALVGAAWAAEGLRAVVASTEVKNVASQRVLEKAGFAFVALVGDLRHFRRSRPGGAG